RSAAERDAAAAARNQPVMSEDNDARAAQLWFAAWLGRDASLAISAQMQPCKFDERGLYLPAALRAHHAAATAHYWAHRRFGGDRFAMAQLRPIQRVLV